MLFARHEHAIANIGSSLYVFGGYAAGDDTMGFVDCRHNESYNFETRQWTALTDTPASFGHIYSGPVTFSGDTYILGGHDKENYLLLKFDADKEVIREGILVGSYVHKMIKMRVAMPLHLLDELNAVNT